MKKTNLITLWTRQDIRSLKDIDENGNYRVKKRYIEEQFGEISEHYLDAYKWLAEEASQIVSKPDSDVNYMIWCSISQENMLRPIKGTVVYKLEVPEDEVVYLDGAKWDYVLNHLYIPRDKKDEKRYKKEMKIKGFHDTFTLIKGKYADFYPKERKEIMDSWKRIFQVDDWNIFTTQANIWEIREEMIVEMEIFD